MTTRSRRGVLAAVVLAAAACGGAPEPAATPFPPAEAEPQPTVTDASLPRDLHFPRAGIAYRCGADAAFVVRMRGDTAEVHLPGQVLVLPPVVAASGTHHASEFASLRTRESEALLQIDGNTISGCRSDVESAPWATARARGVQFRAVGQEPGWHVEITGGARVEFVGDYGDTTHGGRTPIPEVDARAGSIRWSLEAGSTRLEITATDTPCFDVMSGEPYEATVQLRLDQREFDGCGRFLR